MHVRELDGGVGRHSLASQSQVAPSMRPMWREDRSLTEGTDMPCWVAPAVAAEMWGMPVDHVMAKVCEGAVPSKTEAEFLFVDIMPEPWAPAAASPSGPPPKTFVSMSDA